MNLEKSFYNNILEEIKSRISSSQTKAIFAVNKEMIVLYWEIGRIISSKQELKGWGSGVIPKLSKDIKNELPEIKGFSTRNIGRMVSFHKEYSSADSILPQLVAKSDNPISPQAVAKLEELIFLIPWGHNNLLIEKIKDKKVRLFYVRKIIEFGYSRAVLFHMIESGLHLRDKAITSNFNKLLPPDQSDLATQTLKDPYIFDFLTLEEPFKERELELQLVKYLEKFLIELGVGFSFVGRQYKLELSESEYYIDLLFYHLKLRAFIVIELKKGDFKPEYAGKLNFYCNIVDDILKHESDEPTIGLILCQKKDKLLAEYSLKGIDKPIGISEYQLSKVLPDNLKSSLPTIEQIEAEFSGIGEEVGE